MQNQQLMADQLVKELSHGRLAFQLQTVTQSTLHILSADGAARVLPTLSCSRDSKPRHPDPTLVGSLGSQDGSKRFPSASGTLPGVVAAPEPSDSPGGFTHTYACSDRRAELSVSVGCQARPQTRLLPRVCVQGGCQLAASNAGVPRQAAVALLDATWRLQLKFFDWHGAGRQMAAAFQPHFSIARRRHGSHAPASTGAMHTVSLSRCAAGLAGKCSRQWAASLQGGRGGAPPGRRPARCTSCRVPCGCRSACRRSPASTRCGRCRCSRHSTGLETQIRSVRMSMNC